MPAGLRAIDRLKKAANLVPTQRTVTLNDGEEFTFYAKPLTMAERERAQKDAKSDDPGAFALQLLVKKALDSNGRAIFSPGDLASLKHEVRDEDLQKLMLAIISNGEEEEIDMKSSAEGSEE